jgi:hypothetical protein
MIEIIVKGKKKLIGCGGVSKVYECKIDAISTDLVILKIGCDVKKNIKNFQLVKLLGLPTLQFVKEGQLDGKLVLITEHLNFKSEIIYVTPNSVVSDQMKLLRMLDPFKNSNDEDRKESIMEQYRYENKLSVINNFTDFINAATSDLKLASKSKVVIEFDSYFIGSSKNNSITDIDYKIADFDHIFICKDKTVRECFDLNISEFKKVMEMFLNSFTIENEKRTNYFEHINNLIVTI